MVAVRYWSCCNNESWYLIFRTWDVKPPNNQRGCLTSLIPINKLPPPTPPYTGGGLITKRFPLLCKEGLGEVVIKRLTFDKQSGVYR